MIRVALIGCGKMADQHAHQIRRIAGVQIVAVCDSEPLMAQQLAERLGVPHWFADAAAMLKSTPVDAVHLTTPPATHFPLAKLCMDAGCHVYVEKPFTLDAAEAVELIERAGRLGVQLVVGHNAQFTPAMVRMREVVDSGYLGGKPRHIESHYCYGFQDEAYAKALLGDSRHWVRALPGSLLQNIISHGVCRIAEFLSGDDATVIAQGFTSPLLQSMGQNDIIDEVRVLIRDQDGVTAYFTFSSQLSPAPHQLRLYGPKNSLLVDDDHQVVIKIHGREYRSYLNFIVPPLDRARQYLQNLVWNCRGMLAGRFHLPNDSGLATLIRSFYESIEGKSPPRFSNREVLLTARIMDHIFAQTCAQLPRDTGSAAAAPSRTVAQLPAAPTAAFAD
jgi:predicted dehydrogenase